MPFEFLEAAQFLFEQVAHGKEERREGRLFSPRLGRGGRSQTDRRPAGLTYPRAEPGAESAPRASGQATPSYFAAGSAFFLPPLRLAMPVAENLFLNFSMRPAVSTNFSFPVKNG